MSSSSNHSHSDPTLVPLSAEQLTSELTARQHLRPHDSMQAVGQWLVEAHGVCPNAMAESLRWLGIQLVSKIGRLRGTEVAQLGQSLHRFWKQALSLHKSV